MLRLALASVLLLPIMAASQSTMPTGIASPNATQSLSPATSCFGQSPARSLSADRILTAPSLDMNGCAQENSFPVEHGRTAAFAEASTSSALPEAPSASWKHSDSTDSTHEGMGIRSAPPTQTMEQRTNSRLKTMDRQFIVLHSLSTAALVADLETTVRSVAGQPKTNEVNPLFGAHPTRARLYGLGLPLNAVSFYLSYHYKKSEPSRRGWKVGPGLCIAVHTAAAVNNLIMAHR